MENYLEWIEEAEKILRFVYERLSNMTTEQFSKGEDYEIRERILKFLGIDED